MKADRQLTLNRGVFTQTTFTSGALTVLTTLLHRFSEPGRYRVHVSHPAKPVRDLTVRVTEKATRLQVNLDLATFEDKGRGCCCDDDDGIELAINGVLGFYPSTGAGGYRVTVARVPGEGDARPEGSSGREGGASPKGGGPEGGASRGREDGGPSDERLTVLDSEAGVPAGDYFAVVLTRPGRYLLTARDARAEVEVALPRRERLRTDQPTLVVLGREGFTPEAVAQLAGRALVVQCDVAAQLKIELIEPEGGEDRDRPRVHSYRRPRRMGAGDG